MAKERKIKIFKKEAPSKKEAGAAEKEPTTSDFGWVNKKSKLFIIILKITLIKRPKQYLRIDPL